MTYTLSIRISLACGLGLSLAALCLMLGAGSARSEPAGELHVCRLGCPYSSIQTAVDAARDGDLIKIATGVYTGLGSRAGMTQVVYISKTVAVRGGYTSTNWTTPYPLTQPTTLDGQDLGRVIYVTGNASPTVEGLHITGGNVMGENGSSSFLGGGGGIYVDGGQAMFRANTIASNTALIGGGALAYHSAVTFDGNAIISNSAAGCCGSGLASLYSTITLTANKVHRNAGGQDEGGGVVIAYGKATVISNTISENTNGFACGGILLGANDSTAMNNRILSNTAQYYGGGMCTAGNTVLANNLIAGNVLTSSHVNMGGGLIILRPTDSLSDSAHLVNNVINDNRLASGGGSGVWIDSRNVTMTHTTIARNAGGDGSGIFIATSSGVTLINTLVVSQAIGVNAARGSRAALDGMLWSGNRTNTSGADLITATREFTGPAAFATDGYHLTVCSAAIDAGVDAGVTTDIDGEPRPFGPAPDLGADEYTAGGKCRQVYLPLMLR